MSLYDSRACIFVLVEIDNSITNQPKEAVPEKDPLKEALEKAAAMDELHKGPSAKIPPENRDQEEDVPAQAESADDSGE